MKATMHLRNCALMFSLLGAVARIAFMSLLHHHPQREDGPQAIIAATQKSLKDEAGYHVVKIAK